MTLEKNEQKTPEDMSITSNTPSEPQAKAMMHLKSGVTRASFTRSAMKHIQTTPLKEHDTIDTLKIDKTGIREAIIYALRQLMFDQKPTLREKPRKLENAIKKVTIPDFVAQTTLAEIAILLNETLIPECEGKLTGH